MNQRFKQYVWISFSMLFFSIAQPVLLRSQITIDAGNTSGVCFDDILNLNDLSAIISGDVTDGTWLSSGDGIFLPQNSGIGMYSTSTQYVPGPLDIQIGSINFTLASDPHPITGIIETDQVEILIVEDIPLGCNDFVSVGLNSDCEVVITPQHLVNNASPAFNLYEIELYTLDGLAIPTDTIGIQFLDTYINFTVQEACDSIVCWGQILVMDNLAPQLECKDTIISCLEELLPDSLGFPVEYDSIIPLMDNSYILVNGDNCGDAIASFEDEEIEQECFEAYQLIIERTWTVTDTSNNVSQCVQTIFLEKLELFDVQFPMDYDGNDQPVLDCSLNYPLDTNGNPDPIVTGTPNITGCNYLSATYDDVNYNSCGTTSKILRTWYVAEWCSSQVRTETQLIEIADTLAPEIACIDSLSLAVNPYQCNILNESIVVPDVLDNCSNWSLHATIQKNGIQMHYFGNVSGTLDLPNLVLGNYSIIWMAEDICGNSSTCVTLLDIVDESAPFAICKDVSTVSIGSSGAGRLFPNSIDNGSFDNCTDLEFRIRKITDVCFNNTDFGFFIDFCCEEIGTEVMVELEVTDANGLSNYCMTEVLVEDKSVPIINCPSDLTISCSFFNTVIDYDQFGVVRSDLSEIEDIEIYDAYNNGIVGTDGYFQDNCAATVESSFSLDLECSTGVLLRTFVATDGSNNIDSCTQSITIVNEGSFEEEDINWPSDFEYTACDTAFIDPSISGEPYWALEDCSLVSSTYEDEIFILTDTACVKIIRTWSVIDWCQYNEDTGYGLWTEEQVIKIHNLTAPSFINCIDTVKLCITEENCFQHFILSIVAEDDCTAQSELDYSYSLDIGANGVTNHSGLAANFTYALSEGTHALRWRVEDRCGNSTFCDQIIQVADCKSPTPYCLGSLTMAMGDLGIVEVWASEYNIGGTDNCTDVQDLVISFDEEVYTPLLEFSCDDIVNGISEVILLDVWYIDESGNAEFCTVELVLQDNQNICPDIAPDDIIHGRVQDSRDDDISDLSIDLDCEVDAYSQTLDNITGPFAFEGLSNNLYYALHCSKEDSYLEGVTTLDILIIQRHILGLTLLPNGYDVLAADVDVNGKVSGIDIVELRKLILGISPSLPKTNAPWFFVRKDNVAAELDPWGLEENIDLHLNSETAEQQIVGIKYGDVNSSASIHGGIEVESRSAKIPLIMTKHKQGSLWKYDFELKEKRAVEAFQISLNHNSHDTDFQVNTDLSSFDKTNFYVDENSIKISWNIQDLEEELVGPFFYSIITSEDLNFSIDQDFNNVLYTQSESLEFNLVHTDNSKEILNRIKVYTNSNSSLVLESLDVENQSVTVDIYDLQGKKLWTQDLQLESKGKRTLAYSGIPIAGIYAVVLTSKRTQHTTQLFLATE